MPLDKSCYSLASTYITGSNAAALVCLYSVIAASALRPSYSSSSPPNAKKHNPVLEDARKKGFSRTKRGYRNEDGEPEDSETNDDEKGTMISTGWTRKTFGVRLQTIIDGKSKNYGYYSYLNPSKKKKITVETVEQLRKAILDEQLSLKDTTIIAPMTETKASQENYAYTASETEELSPPPLMDHAVRNLIKERYLSGSTPGNRAAGDNSTLALAIEGGGMRGCVSAGMVAAITALGLSDTIDTIYGSSAGSVVGAYMVSRQVCLDIYVDILPASKKLFVCKKRMMSNLASMSLGQLLARSASAVSDFGRDSPTTSLMSSSLSLRERLSRTQPGMNISFVLDGIMGNDNGLRPLDVDAFQKNNEKQKLRIVSSCVCPQTGRMFSKCFGHEDFFHEERSMVEQARNDNSGCQNECREGLFACLKASMTVPGATGPPVNLVQKKKNTTDASPLPCFDAFCFEPIPYRSAVAEGATHVLALVSRPEDYQPKTKQGIYETGVAPLYFNSHGHGDVAEYFERGGQQYIYAEDLMMLEEAKKVNSSPSSTKLEGEGVLVPPPEILYGVPITNEVCKLIEDREQNWNRAHLFPLRVPKGYKELAPLEQDKDEVLEAVRSGFMAAFDSLSDTVGLEGLRGKDVAKLFFPSSDVSSTAKESRSSSSSLEKEILGTKLNVPGELISEYEKKMNATMMINDDGSFVGDSKIIRGGDFYASNKFLNQRQPQQDLSETLLECLPGFREGRYSHLAKGLRESSSVTPSI